MSVPDAVARGVSNDIATSIHQLDEADEAAQSLTAPTTVIPVDHDSPPHQQPDKHTTTRLRRSLSIGESTRRKSFDPNPTAIHTPLPAGPGSTEPTLADDHGTPSAGEWPPAVAGVEAGTQTLSQVV